jgi:hypothetical protein
MTSLVQRRMALQRRRNAAVAYLVIGAAWFIYWVLLLAVPPETPTHWVNLVLAIAWLASGAFELRRYRRQMAAFTEESGVDAGRR